MKKNFFLILVLILLVSPANANSKKPIVLSFTHFFPDVSWFNTQMVVPWAKMVEEKSKGRVKINIYPSASLAKPGTVYDAVMAGTVDIGFDAGPYYTGRHPLSSVTYLPFLGARSSRAASNAWMDLYQKFPELRKEYEDVHLLWLAAQGPGQLISRKPVYKIEDMKGMIIRAYGTAGELVKALGGSSEALPAPHCYLALSKGTIDASLFTGESIPTWKLHEVTKFVTVGDFYVQWFWVVMNKNKFNSLPKDIQDVISECSGHAGADMHGRVWDEADQKGFEFGKKNGMELISLEPQEMERWRAASEPITASWINEMESKGLPGKEIVEAAKKFIEKYNNEFGSWHDTN